MDQYSAVADRASHPPRAIFATAAFGDRPGIAAAELPAARDAVEAWLRAIVLGGQGRYAAARAELRRARRDTRDPVLRSLVTSTEASLLRQLGWHARAAVLDGRALAAVLPDARDGGEIRSAAHREAVCDALTGLAADALGTARPELSARLLERCQLFLGSIHSARVNSPGDTLAAVPDTAAGRRVLVRWHWVSAETALAAPGAGLIARSAAQHADTALELAQRGPSVRHRVKSRLLLAAAAAAAGDLDKSRVFADQVSSQSRENGLLPLRWACAMLRAGVAEGPAAAWASAEAAACAQDLAGHGGVLRSDVGLLGSG
ncbi:hypothetical protein BJY24_003577 [Nocardia transvalensis]|uniref:Uncharacterized protein n=1 Tax=Nocardia transvalensis TaxID=37333 RepID=A0A7W9PF28_9NOCA|nr:hypothetical protein [Nocardia transvalensis]MBB5914710.1 hypothetical protein [Nocardia transvalensis]